MKYRFLISMVTGLIITITTTANAGIISVSNTNNEYASGHFADLQGLEWLSWDTTAFQTRSQIENDAFGLISSGWRYASVNEFDTLFDSLKKGYLNDSQSTRQEWSDGTKWLWQNFDNTDYNENFGVDVGRSNSRIGDLRYGAEGECSPNISDGCRGHVRAYDTDFGWLYTPFHDGTYPVSDSTTGGYDGPDNTLSHVLVRAEVVGVPEPSTLAIFALGMIGLASRRFKKQS